MRETDLVIFDCDGVLVDSEAISVSVLVGQLAVIGIAMEAAFVQENFLGRSFPTVAAEIRRLSGLVLPEGFESGYRKELLERFETELRCTVGLEEVLSRLACPCCVATSSSPARAERTLALAGLTERFGPYVFTASEVARGKPAPDLFLHAAAEMGARPDRVLVVEDSLPGVLAARAAGMQVLVYAGASHMSGEVSFPGAPPVIDSWEKFPLDLLWNSPREAKA